MNIFRLAHALFTVVTVTTGACRTPCAARPTAPATESKTGVAADHLTIPDTIQPPTRGGRAADRGPTEPIGASDRMTLKLEKP